MNPEEIKATHI